MLAVVLAILVASAVPSSASADEVIAWVSAPSPLSAFGGRLLWSEPDGRGAYRLMMWQAGVVSPMPVATRSRPFDADLGPGADGGTVAVYSRCAVSRSCRLYAFDFSTSAERRIRGVSAPRGSETLPSIWRTRLAFVRRARGRVGPARLYVRDVAHRRTVPRVVPGGPKQRCGRRPRYCPDPRGRDAGPTAIDLYGRRLGFVWRYRGLGEGPDHAVLLDSLGGRQPTVEHTHGGGLTGLEPLGVAFESGRLYWARRCFGDPGGCPGRYGLFRYKLLTGATERAPGNRATLGHARADGYTYVLRSTAGGDCEADPAQPLGGCVIERLRPPYARPR
jgi:hypothetical protein